MDKLPDLFTYEEAGLLVRLLLAHLLADFVFQGRKMIENKAWFSLHMLYHIAIVFLLNLLFSFSLRLSLVLTLLHWLTDGIKYTLNKKYQDRETHMFFADQLLHIVSILLIWAFFIDKEAFLYEAVRVPFTDHRLSLLLLAYIFVIWPVGFAMKFALRNIVKSTGTASQEKIEHGGQLIGRFERVIILTFVLMNQYAAIGFLITGKSIIRFAPGGENLRSEYVLLGTMMSYAVSILTGVLTNWLIGL
jgi:hypothetical protein